MNVFEAVKQSVTTRQAAESYGIRVNRSGMACCPFHDDKHPSMKVDNRYHCFGCGADGDVIDFASKLYELSMKEAAMKLADDFGISYDNSKPFRKKPAIREPTPKQLFKVQADRCYRVFSDYFQLLQKWERDYAPDSPDDEWHPLFVEALQKKDYIEYLLDTLLFGSFEDKAVLVAEQGKEVMKLERRMAELTAGHTAGIEKHPKRHATDYER